MFIDITYVVLVLPAVILALIANAWVKSSFNKYSKVLSQRGMTGADAAGSVLLQNGVVGVNIEMISGDLTDHYDPRSNTIRLSQNVYSSTSVAAIGVAAHEAGHAVQYATGYWPMKFRNALIPATNLGSKLAIPLFIAGLLLSYYAQDLISIAYVGIGLYGVCTLFQLATLPAELNASRRAIKAVENSVLTPDETAGARRVLTAAAMTYVAALAVSLMSLLRLLIIAGSRRRD